MLKSRAKPKKFNIIRQVREIEHYTPSLPEDECYKYISTGGFSAIGFVKFVCDRVHVDSMLLTSLRVGRRELQQLNALHRQGKLGMCTIITSDLMRKDSTLVKSYKYYDDLARVCADNGWRLASLKNHSKVILFGTTSGKYVIETSSNFNENPKIEQFSFEKSDALYDFYHNFFLSCVPRGGDG